MCWKMHLTQKLACYNFFYDVMYVRLKRPLKCCYKSLKKHCVNSKMFGFVTIFLGTLVEIFLLSLRAEKKDSTILKRLQLQKCKSNNRFLNVTIRIKPIYLTRIKVTCGDSTISNTINFKRCCQNLL